MSAFGGKADITRPSLDGVKSHHSYWIGVLAADDIANDRFFVGLRFVGFDIRATKVAKVIEHNVHGDIVRLLVWSQWWGPGTHDAILDFTPGAKV